MDPSAIRHADRQPGSRRRARGLRAACSGCDRAGSRRARPSPGGQAGSEAALRAFAADIGDPAGDRIAAALIIATGRRGGAVREVLNSLAVMLARDVAARREIEADRAQHRTTVKWLDAVRARVHRLRDAQQDVLRAIRDGAGPGRHGAGRRPVRGRARLAPSSRLGPCSRQVPHARRANSSRGCQPRLV